MKPRVLWLLLAGLGTGVLYLAVMYGFLYHHRPSSIGASLGFFVLVPFGLGAIPALFSDDDQVDLYRRLLFVPWVSILGLVVAAVALQLESGLCLLVLLVPLVVVGTLAIWIVSAVRLRRRKRRAKLALAATLLLLPLLAQPLETRWLVRDRVDVVERTVTVPASAVWRHIVEVAPIGERELPRSLWNRLGVPRPVRATVDGWRRGAIRLGEFEDGLRFREVMTVFDEGRALGLDVEADPGNLRPGSPQAHLFASDLLRLTRVAYRIEGTRLTLSCAYRLRSDVNPYGVFWARLVLGDFEQRLLEVIARRAREDSPMAAQVFGAEGR